MTELADYVRAHPGKVAFANVAPGSLAHLVGEFYLQTIGGKAEMIPYRSVPQTILALASGEMDVFVAPIGIGPLRLSDLVFKIEYARRAPRGIVQSGNRKHVGQVFFVGVAGCHQLFVVEKIVVTVRQAES